MSKDAKPNISIPAEEKEAALATARKLLLPQHQIGAGSNGFAIFKCDGSNQPPGRIEYGETGRVPPKVFGLWVTGNLGKQDVVGLECSVCPASWVTPASNPGQLTPHLQV